MPGKRKINKKMQAFSSLMKLTKGMTNAERKKLLKAFSAVVRDFGPDLDGESPSRIAKEFFDEQ